MNKPAELKLSRMKFLAFIAVFAGPLLLAIALFYGRAWLPVPSPNPNGILIHPARALDDFSLQGAGDKPLTLESLKGKWTLVYLGGACDLPCQANLYKLRQVRIALGKNTDRTQRVYLLTEESTRAEVESLLEEHPDMRLAVGTKNEIFEALKLNPEERQSPIFVIDPLGNLMLRYPSDVASKSLLKDLKRLLRISQIG